MAVVVLGVLGLVGWPRLKITSIHYDLLRLRAEVGELEIRERALRLELEVQRSPLALAARAAGLGLIPPEEAAADHTGERPEAGAP
jgi:hypothetical protein